MTVLFIVWIFTKQGMSTSFIVLTLASFNMNYLSKTVISPCLILLLSLFFPQRIQASFTDQNDSLLQVIEAAPDDTNKVFLYIKISDWNTYSDSKQAIAHGQSAVDLSELLGFHVGIAKGYERMANAYFQLGDHLKASEHYLKARDANKIAGLYQMEASVYYNLGNIQSELGHYDSCIYYAEKAGEVFLRHNDSVGYGVSLYLASSAYSSWGNYNESANLTLEALEIFQKKGVKNWEVYTLTQLVSTYNAQKKYKESIEILNTCLQHYREINNTKFVAITYRMLGDIYIETENYSKARNDLDSSFYLNSHNGFIVEKCKTMYSQGLLEFNMKNYKEALKKYEDGLELSYELDDELFKCSNYLGIGLCLFEEKQYQASIAKLNKSIEHGEFIQDIYKLKDAFLGLSDNYEAMNDHENALINYKKYKQFSDSIDSQENKRQFAELISKYETEKKEQKISELEQEQILAEAKSDRVISLWIITILIGLIIVSFVYQRLRKNKLLLNKEKELDKVKSRFFSNISHEFRTPLTLIIGPVNDIIKQEASKPIRTKLKLIRDQANRLLQLINQILDLSKLDDNKYQLNVRSNDFIKALKSIVWSFHSMAEIKNINLSLDVDREEWPFNFDRENIETVINNILSNALKFEPDGGRIDIQLQSNSTNSNQSLLLSICNRGSYISEEACALIFDRFYQSHDDKQIGLGSGIGLALSRELIELHGGSIQVDSSVDKGTCFSIKLPTHLSESQNSERRDINSSAVLNQLSDHRENTASEEDIEKTNGLPLILVVEDHAEVQNYIVSTLANNYSILKANNGKQGVEMAIEAIPDIIISDVMMPEMDGIELTHTLKNNEITSHIPILLLSAKASVENRLEGLGVKANDYLTKPFIAEELKLKIQNTYETQKKLKEKYAKHIIFKSGKQKLQSLDDIFISKLCDVIEDNLSNEFFSVQELSTSIGLSRSQLHRKLEALCNKTSSQFIREYRLERAHEFITNKIGTISEIAYKVGFGTTSYFNKCYKEYYKYTPGNTPQNAE